MGVRRHTGHAFFLRSHRRRHASWYKCPSIEDDTFSALLSEGSVAGVAESDMRDAAAGDGESASRGWLQMRTSQPLLPSASRPSEQIGHVHAGSSEAMSSASASRSSPASHQDTCVSSKPDCTLVSSSRVISITVTIVWPSPLAAASRFCPPHIFGSKKKFGKSGERGTLNSSKRWFG